MATRCVSSQVVLGAVVVLIGVVLLAEATGFNSGEPHGG